MMMRNASDFMSDTLNDVLSMQKIEEGKLELDLSPFCISDAISKVFATYRGAVSVKKLTLRKTVDESMPSRIIGDRYRIEHVIANLLSNAVKFSREETCIDVIVKVAKFGAVSEDGSCTVTLTIIVKDEGPGISEENQKRLFSNFVQIRPGQLQEGRGSGLGLALCKQIVQLHGGEIGVNSEEGHGSEFYFTIPFSVFNSTFSSAEDASSTSSARADSKITDKPLPSPMLNGKESELLSTVYGENLGVLVVDGTRILHDSLFLFIIAQLPSPLSLTRRCRIEPQDAANAAQEARHQCGHC
jgi:anti-sigma regulatory factor (Ser/Thr protein kinase)